MKSLKLAMLHGMLAATMEQEKQNEFFEFTNPYSELGALNYSASCQKRYSKTQLTNKQKKSRTKAKLAKKSRKTNRK